MDMWIFPEHVICWFRGHRFETGKNVRLCRRCNLLQELK